MSSRLQEMHYGEPIGFGNGYLVTNHQTLGPAQHALEILLPTPSTSSRISTTAPTGRKRLVSPEFVQAVTGQPFSPQTLVTEETPTIEPSSSLRIQDIAVLINVDQATPITFSSAAVVNGMLRKVAGRIDEIFDEKDTSFIARDARLAKETRETFERAVNIRYLSGDAVSSYVNSLLEDPTEISEYPNTLAGDYQLMEENALRVLRGTRAILNQANGASLEFVAKVSQQILGEEEGPFDPVQKQRAWVKLTLAIRNIDYDSAGSRRELLNKLSHYGSVLTSVGKNQIQPNSSTIAPLEASAYVLPQALEVITNEFGSHAYREVVFGEDGVLHLMLDGKPLTQRQTYDIIFGQRLTPDLKRIMDTRAYEFIKYANGNKPIEHEMERLGQKLTQVLAQQQTPFTQEQLTQIRSDLNAWSIYITHLAEVPQRRKKQLALIDRRKQTRLATLNGIARIQGLFSDPEATKETQNDEQLPTPRQRAMATFIDKHTQVMVGRTKLTDEVFMIELIGQGNMEWFEREFDKTPLYEDQQESMWAAIEDLEQQSKEGGDLLIDHPTAESDIRIPGDIFTIAKEARAILQGNFADQRFPITQAALMEAEKRVPMPEGVGEQVQRYIHNARLLVALLDQVPHLLTPGNTDVKLAERSRLQIAVSEASHEFSNIQNLHANIIEDAKIAIEARVENLKLLDRAYQQKIS